MEVVILLWLLVAGSGLDADEDVADEIDVVSEKLEWFITFTEEGDTGHQPQAKLAISCLPDRSHL
jgi:hypothetical protein